MLTPTLTLTAAVGIFFERFQKNRRMEQLLTGVRPVCIGLLAGVVASFCQTNYAADGVLSPQAVLIGVIDLFLLLRWKVSIPRVILLSAALGLILFR